MREDIIEEELHIAHERLRQEDQRITRVFRQPLRELSALQPVVVLAPSATVREALTVMNREEVSCVLIVEHDRLVGVFTERDVLTKVMAQALDMDHTPVRTCMTRQPASLEMASELAYALHEMSLGGHRHLPLVDDQGRPVALVSMRAIVEALIEAFPQEILNLPPSPAHSHPRTPEGA